MKNINFLSGELSFPLKAKAKIRYRQQDQNCEVTPLENGKYQVTFEQKQKAVASGQIVALYDENDFLVMSGVID